MTVDTEHRFKNFFSSSQIISEKKKDYFFVGYLYYHKVENV